MVRIYVTPEEKRTSGYYSLYACSFCAFWIFLSVMMKYYWTNLNINHYTGYMVVGFFIGLFSLGVIGAHISNKKRPNALVCVFCKVIIKPNAYIDRYAKHYCPKCGNSLLTHRIEEREQAPIKTNFYDRYEKKGFEERVKPTPPQYVDTKVEALYTLGDFPQTCSFCGTVYSSNLDRCTRCGKLKIEAQI